MGGVGYVAASLPPLGVLLQGDEGVDATELEFPVWAALKTPEQIERSKQASWRKQRKEAAKKEKEAAKEEEEEEEEEDGGEGKRGRRRSSRRVGDHFFFRCLSAAAVLRQGRLRRGAEADPHGFPVS